MSGYLTVGKVKLLLSASAVEAVVAAIRRGAPSVSVTVALPSEPKELQKVLNTIIAWEQEHPPTG